jgi:nucleoprotein TPR
MEQIRLLDKRSDELSTAVREREAELERRAEETGERERIWEERVENGEKARAAAEKRADDFKVMFQQLTASAGDGSLDISRAASIASSQRASGKSYTQFYTDYVISQQQLQEKEEKVQQLTQLVDEIYEDLAEQVGAPVS